VLKKIWNHYFIPQERNNHRATLLKPNFLLFFLVLYLLNQSVIKTLLVIKPGVLGYSSEITYQKVLEQTNEERKKEGMLPLQYNSILSDSARKKAQDMFQNDYWAHNSPQGKTPWTFFDSSGYKYSIAGENLAKDFYDTNSLVKAWMNSPTHKSNIMHQKYQEIGIAVVNGTLGGVKTTLVVQHFGTPLVAGINYQPKPEIAVNLIEETTLKENLSTEVLSAENNKKMVSPLTISKVFSSIIFIVLVVVLFVDGFITIKSKTCRLTGSTIGHITFLIFIFLLMLYNQQGSIF